MDKTELHEDLMAELACAESALRQARILTAKAYLTLRDLEGAQRAQVLADLWNDVEDVRKKVLEVADEHAGVQRMADVSWSLLDGIGAHGGDVDVYDDTIGYGRAWVLGDGRDVVDAVLRHIASETALVSDNAQDVDADIWGWCEANLDVMARFGREWNHDRAQIDGTDDGIAHAVTTVQQLATGDYPEDAYWWLADAWGL